MNAFLANISIVLVDTKTPGNIGAVARGMMNMGISRLVLVNPPEDRNGEARKLAAGADDIIDAAAVYSSLKDAVADQGLVIGASRHLSRHRKNVHAPRELAEQVVPLLDRNRLSLVFGNEVNGLEKNDIALCHELVAIPSAEAFSSLNLSHAAMIVMYEFFIAARSGAGGKTGELAPSQDLERLYGRLRTTLRDIAFIDDRNAEHMLFSLRQLFGRARLDSREVSILQGILSAIDNKKH